MRIVVSNSYQDRRGGAETYVERLLALLESAGHDVIAVFDVEPEPGAPRLAVPPGVQSFTVESDGLDATLKAINARDDAIVLANSLDSPLVAADRRIERPLAFYAHTYVSSCINGLRINRRPTPHPCDKVFGPGCLVSYFPRQCGGRSPLTMITAYRSEVGFRRRLADFDLVIANSEAVGRQLQNAGIAAETLHPFIDDEAGTPRTDWRREDRRSLVFLGRFEDYKGGDGLLSALPIVVQCLDVPVHLTMAGDGSQRERWRHRAEQMMASDARISVTFPGWLAEDMVREVLDASDVIVVPSVWPEPFGLVGLEAARYGLPAASFNVGGIPEWLADGDNGHLADGLSCSPQSLANAIVLCLKDIGHFTALSAGAVRRRSRFSSAGHVHRLIGLLDGIRIQ